MKTLLLCVIGICSPLIAGTTPNGSLTESTNDLALKLITRLDDPSENLCISPYSIQSALSMTAMGADGKTHSEMVKALSHPDTNGEEIHQWIGTYEKNLHEKLGKADETKVELKIANRLFMDKNIQLHETFMDQTKKYYGASAQQMDFSIRPDAERKKINAWISEKTADNIQDLLPERSINKATSLVLTNAIYFKADWLKMFNPKHTHKRAFNNSNGEQVEVDFMTQVNRYGWRNEQDYQVIAISYGKKKPMQFIVILPDEEKSLINTIKSLTAEKLASFRNLNFSEVERSLYLPKFENTGNTIKLKQVMMQLGMKEAFGNADFGKICPNPILISDIYHQSCIKIDEQGGEAAAATAVTMKRASLKLTEKMLINRPFFYAIQDCETGLCLFTGTVNTLK